MYYICGNSADFYIVQHDLILSNSIADRFQRTRCTMMRFSLIDFTINWLCLKFVYWYNNLDSFMFYCICNRYRQNHRSILPNFQLFAWFDTLEFNRLPWSNNKIYDDAVFADRFRYHMTMLGMCIVIRLSRLLNTHIAYEIAIQKITTGNWLDAGNDLSFRTVVLL